MIENNEKDPAVLASRLVNNTSQNLFLTGKAGTGKTTFLRHIVASTHKKCVVAAPTGIAAINAGGVTLHSLFQLPFGAFVPQNLQGGSVSFSGKINTPHSLLKDLQLNTAKRLLLREMELLIIDEVSMLRADLLDAIDLILKHVRKNSHKSFGGVQMLFIGDLLQLPPVVKEDEWRILQQHYKSIYFFDAKVLQNEKPLYLELEKVYRQSDAVFIDLLNNLRSNTISKADVDFLNSFYKEGFRPKPDENYITLTTHNAKADRINKDYLQNNTSKSFFYKAKVSGDFNESSYPVEANLELKVGAQIMFVKNDPTGAKRFFNGKIGVVGALGDREIRVLFKDVNKPVVVELYEWQNVKYNMDETTKEIVEQVAGTFIQFPLKLAWAITVHKSQGLTFDKAIVDIEGAFAPGQAYVALSRLSSLNGLVLSDRINYRAIHTDDNVKQFSETKSSTQVLAQRVQLDQSKYLQDMLIGTFTFNDLYDSFLEHEVSYVSEKKKSVKQPHKKWTIEIKTIVAEGKLNADRFLNQLNTIFANTKPDLQHLSARVTAANGYFEKLLNNLSDSILSKIKEIKSAKRVKTFVNELLDLEALCYTKLIQLQKPLLFIDAVLHQKELIKTELSDKHRLAAREVKIRACLQVEEGEEYQLPKSKSGKAKKKDEEEGIYKEEKVSSKEQSLVLFNQGLDINAIAKRRSMAQSTIAGHLAQFVATGQLDSRSLVHPGKAQQIIEKAKELNSFKLSEIKNALQDEYTYNEIKFAIAGYLAESQGV